MHKRNEQDMFQSDCKNCMGLCCVGLYFAKIDGFPMNKPAGQPCVHLDASFHCVQHSQLMEKGCTGCLRYECGGAGQRTTTMFQPHTWLDSSCDKEVIWEVFHRLSVLQQVLFYLEQAGDLSLQHASKRKQLIEENLALVTAEQVLNFDVDAYRQRANIVLKQVLADHQKQIPGAKRQPASLIGRSMQRQSFVGDDFTMCTLIQADFTGSTFVDTSFLGADLRDAVLDDCDLRKAYFLQQMQINSALGNQATKLPKHLKRPAHWHAHNHRKKERN